MSRSVDSSIFCWNEGGGGVYSSSDDCDPGSGDSVSSSGDEVAVYWSFDDGVIESGGAFADRRSQGNKIFGD